MAQFRHKAAQCEMTTSRLRGYKTFFMLNSVEHEISNTHKYKKISRNSAFLGSDKPRMLFFLLINVKIPTILTRSVELSMKNVL